MTTSLAASRPTLSVRTIGQLSIVAALMGAVGGVVTGFTPAAVDPNQYSYPYTARATPLGGRAQ
jgi:hypothetical protein